MTIHPWNMDVVGCDHALDGPYVTIEITQPIAQRDKPERHFFCCSIILRRLRRSSDIPVDGEGGALTNRRQAAIANALKIRIVHQGSLRSESNSLGHNALQCSPEQVLVATPRQ